jgi:branched-chain amino acid transport system permease protein
MDCAYTTILCYNFTIFDTGSKDEMTNWAQVLFNSAFTGSLYLLSAVALTLTYGLSKFPNFAHAEFMTLGAYIGYQVSVQMHLPFIVCILCAVLGSGILGLVSYQLVFGPLSRRGASLIHLMIASMAVGFIARYAIAEIWGWPNLSFSIVWPGKEFGPLSVNLAWVLPIVIALLAGVTMHLVLTRTKIGKAIRGTSSNPQLALSSGINTSRVLLTVWFISGALAGVAGLLYGVAFVSFSPLTGWNILLPIFAVTVLGGIGSFYGAIVAAYLIGLAENVGVVFLSQAHLSTDYRVSISFIILIVVLLIKPEGLTRLFKGN